MTAVFEKKNLPCLALSAHERYTRATDSTVMTNEVRICD
ncbi:hypothetical protein Hjap01_02794 [Haloarcula japonica]